MTVDMFNKLNDTHNTNFPRCKKSNFQIYKERKQGVGWRLTFKCVKCKFISQEFVLFKEKEKDYPGQPGPKAAAANYSLAVGVMSTPMGNARASDVIHSLNVPCSSPTTMQKCTKRVAKAMVQLNDEDMGDKLVEVEKSNIANGKPANQIHISTDGRYSSANITSTKKPGQNALSAVMLAIVQEINILWGIHY